MLANARILGTNRLVGAKPPLRPSHVWASRTKFLCWLGIVRGCDLRRDPFVNVVLSQDSARKPQEFRWHS
jgi:hypothetical protein